MKVYLAFLAGRNYGLNGPNDLNRKASFRTPELKEAWERGRKAGDKLRKKIINTVELVSSQHHQEVSDEDESVQKGIVSQGISLAKSG